jgi:hypothetical protein
MDVAGGPRKIVFSTLPKAQQKNQLNNGQLRRIFAVNDQTTKLWQSKNLENAPGSAAVCANQSQN